MKPASSRANALPQSGIRELMALAELVPDVIHLEVGEPSFTTPEHIIRAAFADALAGWTRYTPTAGLPTLRQAVAERHTPLLGRAVDAAEVVISVGAVGALAAGIFALCETGDEVLIPDPGWPNYRSMVQLADAVPRPYRLSPEAGYVPSAADVEHVFTDRTKAIIISNPSNPTGSVLPGLTIKAMVELAVERGVYVIADEVYGDLVYDGEYVPAGRFDEQSVITVAGCSKTYAMTGWRIGWAIAARPIASLMTKLQEPLVSCPPSVSQRAAEAALRGPQDAVSTMRETYRRRRDLACAILEPAGLLAARPGGAFYAMVDLRQLGMSSGSLARLLLEEEHVATAPGDTFGASCDGMLRISVASPDEAVQEGCQRIVRFAARHATGAAAKSSERGT